MYRKRVVVKMGFSQIFSILVFLIYNSLTYVKNTYKPSEMECELHSQLLRKSFITIEVFLNYRISL